MLNTNNLIKELALSNIVKKSDIHITAILPADMGCYLVMYKLMRQDMAGNTHIVRAAVVNNAAELGLIKNDIIVSQYTC